MISPPLSLSTDLPSYVHTTAYFTSTPPEVKVGAFLKKKKENSQKKLVAKSKGEWKEDPKEMLLMTFCNSRTKKEGKGESRAFGEAHRLLARTLLIIERPVAHQNVL